MLKKVNVFERRGMKHNNEQLDWMRRKTYGTNVFLNNSPIKKHIQKSLSFNWDVECMKYGFVDYAGCNISSCSGCSFKLKAFLLDEFVRK